MSLDPALRSRIDALLQQHRVVLFMKGVPGAPQCGFSAKATGILDGLGVPFHGVNVLADQDIREGIKAYGNWPTIPQLYVAGELIGGSDIIEGLLNSGELHGLLDLAPPDRSVPQIGITPAAADAIRSAMADADPSLALHLSVDSRFNAQFALKPAQGNEIVAEAAGIRVLFDLASAPRAKGIEIDWVDDVRGAGLTIRNPNAPPAVKSLSVQDLHDRIIAGTIDVIDVRPADARAIAPFPQPHDVLDEDSRERLEALPKDLPIAFLCHHGNSSRQAAEHFRQLGFHDISNVEGGIDAWSLHVDPRVPRY
ncbi:Grx4 family monothiol glutaredoxin [Chiayiivirga flava]|uniref:Monothiol glutaredoxin n=1 Tax=Chiayiivirga flava TaxID=659595 RepID=A0A7W8G1U0_9GAMM|nr:Grx4 family monothiol glutaredoxin [Chiayiivirga flava]MBB5209228.1 monothiol glutaredoxin [Chiayiivirga flava]